MGVNWQTETASGRCPATSTARDGGPVRCDKKAGHDGQHEADYSGPAHHVGDLVERWGGPSLTERARDFYTKAVMGRGSRAGDIYEARAFGMVPSLVSLADAQRRRADAWEAFADALHKGDNESMVRHGAAAHQAAKDVAEAEADREPLTF